MANQRPPKPPKVPTQITPEQKEALGKLGNILNRPKPYTPVTKSLDAAGITPRIMVININDKPMDCMVIPIEELVYKEWVHMTGGLDNPPTSADVIPIKPQEESNDDGN